MKEIRGDYVAKETSNDKEKIINEEDEKVEDRSTEDLMEKIESLEREYENLNSQFLRLQADFVNYRNRMNKEKESSIAYGTEIIVTELLPVIDNFNRALEAQEDKDSEETSFYQGIKMIEKQLMDTLEKNSVVEIQALGCEFDPNYHHAVVMEESDEYESNIVIEVLQKGYLLKDKVIRPSMVKVSK